MSEEKVACRTPTEGKTGVTNLPKWKFDVLHEAITEVVSEDDIRFANLKEAVRSKLAKDVLERLGSLGWHLTSVKLEMEVRGEIQRHDVKGPQVIGMAR